MRLLRVAAVIHGLGGDPFEPESRLESVVPGSAAHDLRVGRRAGMRFGEVLLGVAVPSAIVCGKRIAFPPETPPDPRPMNMLFAAFGTQLSNQLHPLHLLATMDFPPLFA